MIPNERPGRIKNLLSPNVNLQLQYKCPPYLVVKSAIIFQEKLSEIIAKVKEQIKYSKQTLCH